MNESVRHREFDRASLMAGVEEVLQQGRGTSADVFLVATTEGQVVVKDFANRSSWLHRRLGRWSLRREERAYARLRDLRFVPKLLGRVDADAIVIEYRPGILLSRSLAGSLPKDFVEELEATVTGMHARGVVHLDLRHRSNVLAGQDGHPVLLDFASAIFFEAEGPWGRAARELFAWVDRRALHKWRVRLVQPGDDSSNSAGSRGDNRAM